MSFHALFVACSLSAVGIAVRRALFHPLSKVPGPSLAAVSGLYKAYFDICCNGGWVEQLRTLHAKYGQVVRVGPNELHFNDPNAYGQIYASGLQITKDHTLYDSFTVKNVSFTFTDPRANKERREIIGPLFTRRTVSKLEPAIQRKIDRLVSRLVESEAVNMSFALRCATADIIDEYLFAESQDMLSAPIKYSLSTAVTNGRSFFWVYKYFPFFQYVMEHAPIAAVAYLNPSHAYIRRMKQQLAQQLDKFIHEPNAPLYGDHETLYHRMISGRRDAPLRIDIVAESQNLHFAGSDTVRNTCTFAVFHVLDNEDVQQKLKEALKDVWPDVNASVGLEVLEKVPYLTAVIKEALRVSFGVVTPLSRVVGGEGTEIGGMHVPAGTIVGLSHFFVHMDTSIFAEPEKFNPERWMQPDSTKLDPFLVAFSKGPRACIGVNLAWAELYLILGNLFRRLDMGLYDTKKEDMAFRAYFGPILTGNAVTARVSKSI